MHLIEYMILYSKTVLYNDVLFHQSNVGCDIFASTINNANAVFRYCPSVLLFGGWDSNNVNGTGAKFQKSYVSEIVGYDAIQGISLYSKINNNEFQTPHPSKIDKLGGVTISRIEQTTTISFIVLRNLPIPKY